MAKTLSGVIWVSKFPTSASVEDLADPFKADVKNFIAALKKAGAHVSIAATKRPKERAFLMHYSYKVAKEHLDPAKVPEMAGVDIEWVHRDAKNNVNLPASRTAAGMMVTGYEIAYAPALTSRHIEGNAIDMHISWTSATLVIKDGAGQDVTIKSSPKSGGNTDLHAVGKSYGVVNLVKDPPHWSTDGH